MTETMTRQQKRRRALQYLKHQRSGAARELRDVVHQRTKDRQRSRELAIAAGELKPGLALSAIYGQHPGHRVRQKKDETGKRASDNLERMH